MLSHFVGSCCKGFVSCGVPLCIIINFKVVQIHGKQNHRLFEKMMIQFQIKTASVQKVSKCVALVSLCKQEEKVKDDG